jgi:hypothetical protein
VASVWARGAPSRSFTNSRPHDHAFHSVRARTTASGTRFARDKYDHFALRSHLQSLGISLRSATEPIDDTSTGKLMEGVLAEFAQFDNDCRSDRTRAGMKAALELGRWTFLAPIGYLNAPRATRNQAHFPVLSAVPLVRRDIRLPVT